MGELVPKSEVPELSTFEMFAFLVGTGLNLISWVAQAAGFAMNRAVARLIFGIGTALILSAFGSLVWRSFQPASRYHPDIGIWLFSPADPIFSLRNVSDAVLSDPKFFVAMFNLDGNDVRQPLKIPEQTLTGEFIRPHEGLGLWSLWSSPLVEAQYKLGDRLFGFVEAQCPDCLADRYFWIYLVAGKNGWFAPTSKEAPFIALQAFGKAIPIIAKNADVLLPQIVPQSTRTTISNAEFPKAPISRLGPFMLLLELYFAGVSIWYLLAVAGLWPQVCVVLLRVVSLRDNVNASSDGNQHKVDSRNE